MKHAPIKAEITFDDFARIDIRVGRITEVSEVAKSDKLMKLTVDFGDHTRSILAGIKQERENPKEIEGKQALFVVNLPERKMAGEVSQGMLFDIGYEDKLLPCLACPETEMPNGARALRNPLMILIKIMNLRWMHILSCDQMVLRKIN